MADPMTPERLAQIREWCTPAPAEPSEEDRARCDAGECGGCFLCWGPPIPVTTCGDVLALLDEVERQAAEVDRLRADLESAEVEIETRGETIDRLRAERDPDGDLCIENGNLRAEVERLRAENKQLGAEVTRLFYESRPTLAEVDGQDEEPDVIEITDDDLLTILRRPLARADDDDWPTVTVDTMALRLALDAWDRTKTERDEAVAERDRLRAVHTGIRRIITAWERQPLTHHIRTTGAARILREILGGEDVAFADEPAELTADHTLRTAAGQEAS